MKTRRIHVSAMLVAFLILALAVPHQNVNATSPLCVKPGGADGCHATIQGAIDAAIAGDTIHVYPGTYSETATNRTILAGTPVQQGPHQFGLFFPNDKDGLSLIGMNASGIPITDPTSADLPYITTNATNNFGYSGIWVEGDNVTLQGLNIGPNSPSNNKTFEIVANGFTLRYSKISVPGGGAVYFGDWLYNAGDSAIESYTIDGNLFDQGALISINNGAGYSGDVSGRIISNNVFQMTGANWPAISFTGSDTTVPWFVHPVGGAVITGNAFSGSTQYIRSRGTVDESDFDWATYWSDNAFDKKVMAGPNPPAQPRAYTYVSGGFSLPNTKRIGAVIQEEIGNAQAGDTVLVGAGTYAENIVISKSVYIAGAGQESTTVMPAVSNANPCTGSSLCGGTASNVFLIQANDVKIHDLTIDGDNPALTSNIDRDGADLDARNGIIKNTTGTFNNLEVYNTTVKNIYLRGIYSTGGTFNFHHNTVTNVQGDYYSIAIFAWYGPGTITNNVVSNANDAIAANWSKGIQFLDNTVTSSGTGVHTDNAGSGSTTADLIQGNTISNCKPDGYGIFVFVPYIAPTVNNNTITNCTVGLSAWGQYNPVMTQFTNNTVTGPAAAAGSVGAYITTDQIGYGYNDVSVNFTGNFITGFETGVYLTADAQTWTPGWTSKTITATLSNNSIAGNTNGLDKGTAGSYAATATHNWWGTNAAAGVAALIDEDVPYTPWLCSGTDTSSDPGFQPTGQTDCAAPVVTGVSVAPSPVYLNAPTTVTAVADDSSTGGSNLVSAEFSLNGGAWQLMTASDTSFDSSTENVQGSFTAATLGTNQVCVRAADSGGNVSIQSCTTFTVGYVFTGFFQPVDNLPLVNVAKAGQTIPLKWRLTDANGAPVLNLASVTVTVASLSCTSGSSSDQVEEYASGASGLQNLGNGYYQFNWKTPTSYANSCKTMKLNLGNGVLQTALFQFKR